LDLMEKTAHEMVQITRQMLDLSSSDDFDRRDVCVNDIVESAVCAFRSDLPSDDVKVRTTLYSGDTQIGGGHDQLSRCVQKLCQNAVEAIGEHGNVDVSTARVSVPSGRRIASGSLVAGDYLTVSVADSGPGIPVADRERVLDPFYTTKRDRSKRGAGLGLCYTYLVAAAHGGGVDIGEGGDGKGCVVTLYLSADRPIADEPPLADTVADAVDDLKSLPLTKPEEGGVLIVDDDAAVRDSFSRLLSKMPGVDVRVAADGKEAVAAFSSRYASVVLMDIHMPGMDGFAAFSEIDAVCRTKGWEKPAVIFCTGYAPADPVRRTVADSPRHMLLMKPVMGGVLVDAVRARLGQR
jgi:CheY-like chemotaxis protein/anti-sigma regulatory factor (Ser/Thr protein kinase)